MSAKLTTLDLLKITVFWIKVNVVIIIDHNVTNKILSRDSNFIVNLSYDQSLVTLAFLWEKLSQPQFYKDLVRKNNFFEGPSWLKFNNLRLALGVALKFYTSVTKGLKLKIRKFWGLISTFVEVIEGKLVVGSPPLPPLSQYWIGLRNIFSNTSSSNSSGARKDSTNSFFKIFYTVRSNSLSFILIIPTNWTPRLEMQFHICTGSL